MTISEDVRAVIERLATSLPPAVLSLLCLNLLFVGLLLWFLRGVMSDQHDQNIARMTSMEHVLNACTEAISKR